MPGWIVRHDAPEEALEFLRMLTGIEAQTTSENISYDVPSIAGADTAVEDRPLAGVASDPSLELAPAE